MRRLVLIAVLLLIPCVAFSKTGNSVPFVVEAQKLTYNDKQKVAYYVGSVIAQHGNTIITGDRLTIYFDPSGRHIRKIVVEGNVHIKDSRGEGWCKKLVYYPVEEKVILIGNARLKRQNNVVVGDRIVAYKSGEVNVEGIKQKVKTVIYPQEKSIGKIK